MVNPVEARMSTPVANDMEAGAQDFERHVAEASRGLQLAQSIAPPMPWWGPRIGPLPRTGPHPPIPLTPPDTLRPEHDPRFNQCRKAANGSVGDWEDFCRSLPFDRNRPDMNRQCWENAYESPQRKHGFCHRYFDNDLGGLASLRR